MAGGKKIDVTESEPISGDGHQSERDRAQAFRGVVCQHQSLDIEGVGPDGWSCLVVECDHAVLFVLGEEMDTSAQLQACWGVSVVADLERLHDGAIRNHEQTANCTFVQLEQIAIVAFEGNAEQAAPASIVEFSLEVLPRNLMVEQDFLGACQVLVIEFLVWIHPYSLLPATASLMIPANICLLSAADYSKVTRDPRRYQIRDCLQAQTRASGLLLSVKISSIDVTSTGIGWRELAYEMDGWPAVSMQGLILQRRPCPVFKIANCDLKDLYSFCVS